jgi:hypothetical protein
VYSFALTVNVPSVPSVAGKNSYVYAAGLFAVIDMKQFVRWNKKNISAAAA